MTTLLSTLTRTSSGNLLLDAIVPGPSSGAYVVGHDDGDGTVVVARITSAGLLVWSKDITIPSMSPLACAAASSSNRLAIAAYGDFIDSGSTCIAMLDDTGSLVWESVIDNFAVCDTEGLLIGSDNSVYVRGVWDDGPRGTSQYDAVLLKLNPTTGAITWQVGLTETGTTGHDFSIVPTNEPAAMRQLSGGDIVLALYGPGSTSTDHGYVQRISSSDGSVVWTRKLDFAGPSLTSTGSVVGLGVDESDNIYCTGPPANYSGGGSIFATNGNELPVVKLGSDGSTTWVRHVRRPSNTYTPVYQIFKGALSADSSGVFISGNVLLSRYGHLHVPAAGTVSTGNVPLTSLNPVSYGSGGFARAGQAGVASAMYAFRNSSTNDFRVVVSPAGAGDDGTYDGSIARATVDFDLIAGSTTVTTPGSWTRPSAPSFTLAADRGITVGTGTLTAPAPAQTCTATSLGPTTNFGPEPYLQGYTRSSAPSTTFGSITVSRSFINVGLTPPSTTFGTAASQRLQRATALGPTANFGTPAYQPNTTRAADSLGLVLAGIGTPFATLGIAPQPPGYASSVEPATTFGAPAAHQGISLAASGTLVTQFGTASARYSLAATGLSPATQFGTATVTMARGASGFRVTQLGTPAVGLYGLPSGFLRTQFGAPAARMPVVCQATGFLVTNMGGGSSGGAWNLRTRSAYFRTRFGTPQAERTAP